MMDPVGEPEELLHRAGAGDQQALNQLLTMHRDRLRWMVQLRLNRRLQGRVDPSDVVQEAYLEICKGLPAYLQEPRVPFYLWLRSITGKKLLAIHRHHLGTRMRDARQEQAASMPEADTGRLAAEIVGHGTSASGALHRAELQLLVQQALNTLDPIDREVLTLRHFELLSNEETAVVLGLQKSAASNRYVRALRRLKEVLSRIPGLLDDSSEDET